MILVDTSLWIDHFRQNEPHLHRLLDSGMVLGHSWVRGELALGNLPDRSQTLRDLAGLPQCAVANLNETLAMVESNRLFGLGIGLIDACLLASVLSEPGARIWTRDSRLSRAAATLDVEYEPPENLSDAM